MAGWRGDDVPWVSVACSTLSAFLRFIVRYMYWHSVGNCIRRAFRVYFQIFCLEMNVKSAAALKDDSIVLDREYH